ncbi:MAG: hypothetical protein ABSF70_09225 [Terracidiphilus sp.]
MEINFFADRHDVVGNGEGLRLPIQIPGRRSLNGIIPCLEQKGTQIFRDFSLHKAGRFASFLLDHETDWAKLTDAYKELYGHIATIKNVVGAA